MSLKIGKGGEYLGGGTHDVKFLGFDDGIRIAPWGEKQANIRFKSIRGTKTTTWSVSWPDGLVAAYMTMGGKNPPSDFDGLTYERVTAIMAQDLRGWSGSLRVGEKGFAHGLSLPDGDYVGDFAGFSMRKDGKPRIGYNRADSSYAHRTMFLLKVIEGSFEGLAATVNIPVAVTWDPDEKDMGLADNSAVYKVFRMAGVDWSDIYAQIERAGGNPQSYFANPENPLPELEVLAYAARDKGRHFGFTVKNNGYVDHQELLAVQGVPYDHGPQQGGQSAGIFASLIEAMNKVTDRLFMDAERFGKNVLAVESGKLTKAGIVLAKQAIRPIVQAEEWDVDMKWGKVRTWPADYLKKLAVFFDALADEDVMTETVLRLMFGDSDEGREMVLDFYNSLPSEAEQAEAELYDEQDDIPF